MKNECQFSEEICSNYVEHDLLDGQKIQFENHLKSCPACLRKVTQLQLIKNSIREIPSIHASKDFETILRARIQMTKNIGRGQWASILDLFKLPAYAVSMTAVIATAFFLHFSSASQQIQHPIAPDEIIHTFLNEAEIQPGDIVYAVDILTFPKESLSIRISEKKKSSVTRSMIIAHGTMNSDSTATKIGLRNSANEANNAVSF